MQERKQHKNIECCFHCAFPPLLHSSTHAHKWRTGQPLSQVCTHIVTEPGLGWGGVGGRDVLTYVPQPLWEGLGQASSSYFCWPNHSSTTTCCCQGPPSPLLGLTFGSDILPRGTLLKIACLCWQVALKRELSCLGEEGASFFFRSNLENYRFPVGKNMIISY